MSEHVNQFISEAGLNNNAGDIILTKASFEKYLFTRKMLTQAKPKLLLQIVYKFVLNSKVIFKSITETDNTSFFCFPFFSKSIF